MVLLLFLSLSVLPYFASLLKDPFPQKASHSHLGLDETLEKVASQKKNGGENILVVTLDRHRGRACVKLLLQNTSLTDWP